MTVDTYACSVLLIDDDPAMRRSLALYLEDRGCDVVQAVNGADGIRLFGSHQPDIVLTDLMMPDMDGVAVVKAIRRQSADTPVVVISGNGSINYAIETVRHGAWDYITKPIHDFAQLDQIIITSLKRTAELKEAQSRQMDLALHSVELAEQMAQLKQFDPLTGLPLRHRMEELFHQQTASSDRMNTLNLLMLDLNSLKTVNKSLGLEAGDQVLVQAAQRLATVADGEIALGSLGGDQFILLARQDKPVQLLVHQLFDLFDAPFVAGSLSYQMSASIGIASYPQDGESFDRLLQNANIAMNKAKKLGKNNYCLYEYELGAQAMSRITLELQLQQALKRKEFVLYYQPKVSADDGRLAGIETLIRWQHADSRQITGPDHFIPILEETGMIQEVGDWIVHQACYQYMQWRTKGMPPVSLSVNISAVQILNGALPQTVASILASCGMEPERLCLELTESVLLEDDPVIRQNLEALAQTGVRFSIDDFGTGYASLAYLLKIPIHELKIDRTFVQKLPDNRHAVAITDSIIGLGGSMGVKVVAEGVEYQEQAEFLKQRGCHELQGYLFSKPVPAEQIEPFFRVRM